MSVTLNRRDAISAGVVMVFAAGVFATSRGLPSGPSDTPGAGIYPAFLALCLFALAIVQIVQSVVLQPTEEEACSGNGITPVELTVATDALTVVVNNDADWVDCLTTEELREIWSAESTPSTWSEVNSDWPDEPLELYGPTDASGTYDYFIEAVLGEEGPGHRQDYSATEQDRTIIQGVEGSENAIGYLGFAYYSQNQDRVKALGIDDGDGCVEPSLETARSGEYTPLSRPLFTYAKQESLADEHVAEFARFWLENASSQDIVADEVGYVPLSDADQQEAMDALEAAIEEAQG